MHEPALDAPRLVRLIEAGRGLIAQLDLETVLDRLLETARELTGARFAALGVLNPERSRLERFLTAGVGPEVHRAIGHPPRGRGVLGVLVSDPRPLRLADVSQDPRSSGFPPGHPPMTTFLGVPVLIHGEAWGNLYLTEKAGGAEFTAADEAAVVVLADWAAIAIENARLYEAVDRRRGELERAVRAFEATAAVARAAGGETDVGRVLELVVQRGRALVNARALLVLLQDGDELEVGAGAGPVRLERGVRVPLTGALRSALEGPGRGLVDDVEAALGADPARLGVPDPAQALLVRLAFRGRAFGLVAAFDRLDGAGFDADDGEVLEAFAAAAGTAVATAQTVETERLRFAMRAAEEERRRWARELHDETLQGLAGLRMILAGAARVAELDTVRAALARAAEEVDSGIENLRAIIADLRPAVLDELGLAPALSALVERAAAAHGLDIDARIELGAGRLAPELETVAYRTVQEALTNVAKHAGAGHVEVEARAAGEHLSLRVADDGVGLPAAHGDGQPNRDGGHGLIGMRERVALAGGELALGPRADGRGTEVRVVLPLAGAP